MIHYDEYGDKDKPVILLLHGAAAVDTFAQQYCFADQYHLIVPHLYGAGESVEILYEPSKMINELLELIHSLGNNKIIVIGHSLGAQLAVALVSKNPELFSVAVFLSAWINPTEKAIAMYNRLATMTSKTLHIGWLIRFQGKYWHYTKEQADYMAEYAKKITLQQYQAFFLNTINLDDYPEYKDVTIPMLAVCGQKEVKDMKRSLQMLESRNSHCKTVILPKANHDFPMRNVKALNLLLRDFLKTI